METIDLLYKAFVTVGLGVFLVKFFEFKGAVDRFMTNEWPHYARKVDRLIEHLGLPEEKL